MACDEVDGTHAIEDASDRSQNGYKRMESDVHAWEGRGKSQDRWGATGALSFEKSFADEYLESLVVASIGCHSRRKLRGRHDAAANEM